MWILLIFEFIVNLEASVTASQKSTFGIPNTYTENLYKGLESFKLSNLKDILSNGLQNRQ